LELEERRLTVCDPAEDRAAGLTCFGIDNIAEIVQLHKAASQSTSATTEANLPPP
jgi:hypothetical protein